MPNMKQVTWIMLPLVAAGVAACGSSEPKAEAAARAPVHGAVYVVRDTVVPSRLDAFGVAAPVERATVSTRLMGTITEVDVHEGDTVRTGQVLARIDARDLAAKQAQTSAAITEAEAVYKDAQTQAARMRALYADSAAPKAQLDAAETGLARAEAAVNTAHAAAAEVEAVRTYAVLRAPFHGVVTQRFVDPGALAAPGAPIVAVENSSRLRISVTASPAAVHDVHRGMTLDATIEGVHTPAVVEGVVPNPDGSLYTVNALVDNRRHTFLPGSSASLALVQGTRHALFVPAAALFTQGDLTGVHVVTQSGSELRWVRTRAATDGRVEILSGLRPGERVLLETVTPETAS